MSNLHNILEDLKNISIPLEPLRPYFGYLEPKLNEKTISVHYNKHHLVYYEYLKENKIYTLNDAIKTHNHKTIDFAYQLIYHNMFWKSLSLENSLDKFEELYPNFKSDFYQILSNSFGSGWMILIKENEVFTWKFLSNAEPYNIKKILLIFDIWEHAYYLQFYENKTEYFETLLSLSNFTYFQNQMN